MAVCGKVQGGVSLCNMKHRAAACSRLLSCPGTGHLAARAIDGPRQTGQAFNTRK